MSQNLLDNIRRQIEILESNSGAWPDFIQAMRLALLGESESSVSQANITRFAQLPGLCCQAAGGEATWADEVAAAWLMCYAAAHLFDCVEDQDQPDPWWASLGPGAAINVASGLLLGVPLVLNRLHQRRETQTVAQDVVKDFFSSCLIIGSGQHRDLVVPQLGLAEWVEIASAKSGGPFALACRAGAQLAKPNPARLEAFSRFGWNLGMLLQVVDDLEIFQNLQPPNQPSIPVSIKRSLPLVYALEVSPPETQAQFHEILNPAGEASAAGREELVRLLDQCGAGMYLIAEMERYKVGALSALEAAHPEPDAGSIIAEYILQIHTA